LKLWLLTWVYELQAFELRGLRNTNGVNWPSVVKPPVREILQPGGHILMARYNREIVGTFN